jgi:hypothetical protein
VALIDLIVCLCGAVENYVRLSRYFSSTFAGKPSVGQQHHLVNQDTFQDALKLSGKLSQ